jgi:hypothetical protein
MAFVGGNFNQGLVRESPFIREALQKYSQAPDADAALAVTKGALDEVVLRGNATEQQIAESTLEAVGRCCVLKASAAKTYQIALSSMLGTIPPSIGIATLLAVVGKQSMAEVDPSDGLRIGESFLYEAGRLGGRAEQSVAQAGRAVSNSVSPDGAAEILQSALTTLTNPGPDQKPNRLVGSAEEGLVKFQGQVDRDLRWISDFTVTPEEKERAHDHLQNMLETGQFTIPDQVDDPHFLVAKHFR